MRGRVAIALALALGGCLRENEDFIEPAPLFGDCAIDPGACADDLVCQEVPDRTDGGPPGFVCSQFDCDADADCPVSEDSPARPRCRATNLCILDCTPMPCASPDNCDTCPPGRSCAMGCGPPPDGGGFDCVPCPPDMECIPWQSGPSFQCAHR